MHSYSVKVVIAEALAKYRQDCKEGHEFSASEEAECVYDAIREMLKLDIGD